VLLFRKKGSKGTKRKGNYEKEIDDIFDDIF
jgi:hypothetical protein